MMRGVLYALLLSALCGSAGCSPPPAERPEDAPALLRRILAEPDSTLRGAPAARLIALLDNAGTPLAEDSGVLFLFAGSARTVTVAGEMNRWRPDADTLRRIPGTPLHYLERPVPAGARFEYKLVADGEWMLDPLNPRRAPGGFGPNSECTMPGYAAPRRFPAGSPLRHGRFDTLGITSRHLGRICSVLVYVPQATSGEPLPSLTILDGMDYIRLAEMHLHADHLIGAGSITPVLGVFVEPRATLSDTSRNFRMEEYTMSDSFVAFLADELIPLVQSRFRTDPDPRRTGILGASLGGLAAAYAAVRRPDVFGFAAPQSASFWWKDTAIARLVRESAPAPVRWVITTGTLRDAEVESRAFAGILRSRGADVTTAEHPEGHNWTNWRGRLEFILTSFAGPSR